MTLEAAAVLDLLGRDLDAVCPRRPRIRDANVSASTSSTPGPRRAMPGTDDGFLTRYAASDLRVPASVRSNPEPSSRRTRIAIGPLPGRSGSGLWNASR